MKIPTRRVGTLIPWVTDIGEVRPVVSNMLIAFGGFSFGICQVSLRNVEFHVGTDDFGHVQRRMIK